MSSSGGWCSLVILCIGSVSALCAMALVAIAVNTDHWVETRVDRDQVVKHGKGMEVGEVFYSRTRGLFRVCFPSSERPPVGTPGLFLSLVEEWCLSRNYHINYLLEGRLDVPNMTDQGMTQLWLSRSTPALLALYLALMAAIGLLGLAGCWAQSSNKLITTAAVQLFAALVGATGMATWHAALFMEMEKVHEEGFPLTWPHWLQEATQVGTGWSYLVAWAGVCLTLLASLATSASAIALRAHRRDWEEETLRMKLKMSSMFAGHTYYPGDISQGSTPLPSYPNTYRIDPRGPPGLGPPGLPDRFSPHQLGPERMSGRSTRETSLNLSTDRSTIMDYRTVMGELSDSKF